MLGKLTQWFGTKEGGSFSDKKSRTSSGCRPKTYRRNRRLALMVERLEERRLMTGGLTTCPLPPPAVTNPPVILVNPIPGSPLEQKPPSVVGASSSAPACTPIVMVDPIPGSPLEQKPPLALPGSSSSPTGTQAPFILIDPIPGSPLERTPPPVLPGSSSSQTGAQAPFILIDPIPGSPLDQKPPLALPGSSSNPAGAQAPFILIDPIPGSPLEQKPPLVLPGCPSTATTLLAPVILLDTVPAKPPGNVTTPTAPAATTAPGHPIGKGSVEAQNVQTAINFLRSMGETDAANHLQTLLNTGKLFWEEPGKVKGGRLEGGSNPDNADTTNGEITLAAAIVHTGNQPFVAGRDMLLIVRLAATLYHENIHTQQGLLYKGWLDWAHLTIYGHEVEAWAMTEHAIRRWIKQLNDLYQKAVTDGTLQEQQLALRSLVRSMTVAIEILDDFIAKSYIYDGRKDKLILRRTAWQAWKLQLEAAWSKLEAQLGAPQNNPGASDNATVPIHTPLITASKRVIVWGPSRTNEFGDTVTAGEIQTENGETIGTVTMLTVTDKDGNTKTSYTVVWPGGLVVYYDLNGPTYVRIKDGDRTTEWIKWPDGRWHKFVNGTLESDDSEPTDVLNGYPLPETKR